MILDESDLESFIPELIHHQDEPIADWVCVPLYFVSKLARDNGTIVVQVGEGSDELFHGYDHYISAARFRRRFWEPFQRVPRPLRNATSRAALGAVGARRARRGARPGAARGRSRPAALLGRGHLLPRHAEGACDGERR